MWLSGAVFILTTLLFVGSSPKIANAFNVETKHYAVYRSEARSMFGFSVTAYRDRYGRGWAVVGAPEAQTSQVGVYRGGAVYKCDIATDDSCDIIHFDDKGNNHVKNPSVHNELSQIDNKTLQWFGATVSASITDGGPILACAPRYIWFSVSQPRTDPDDYRKESTVGNRREPVGTCWVVKNNFNDSQEYSPCRTRYWGYHRQGSCQAGMGASVSKNGERLFIGAPGSWYWQGQQYSISTNMKFGFLSTVLFTPEALTTGQAFSQPLATRNRVMFTKEGPANEDDSYMGYAVTTGDFVGDGDAGTAVGVPRGSGLRGKVVLFTSNMKNHRNITGEQMGAYFGYSVASGDIDGDGLDDLIVGAPMYTIPDNPEMTIETGRIYVIYQGTGEEKFRKIDTRDGESNRGRFGLSLASLGDIDHDGFGDIAVGAPYGGPNGRGAVYIYHGSATGVQEKYSQAIHAEDLDTPVQTFGFSVAGGLDLDGNRYPDMVVGSYESSAAMFFRARPVIKMDSYVVFESESKLISLDNRNCVLSDGTVVTCLPLKACFKYSGDGVLSRHNFDVQYVLDVKKTKNPRLFFLELEGRSTMNHTITVEKDHQFCRTVKVYVTPNIRDKLTSLDAEMRMSLAEERLPDTRRRDPRVQLRPVLGATTSRKDSLTVRKNCGSDNVCIPNLQLTVQPNVGRYLLGSGRKLELEVLVQNNGEDAFEATYNLKLPAGIDYIKIERIDKTEVPVQCSAPKQSNNNTLRCDIGNPLPQRQLVHFNVLLQPVTSRGMKPSYEFDMEVNTTNPEHPDTVDDNTRHISLPIWIETELLVEGESKPKDLYYNPDNYTAVNVTTELEFGPAVTYNYTIRNMGPSDILEAEAFLIWPAQTLAGEELMYLLEQPETSGPIACEPANANYLSLKLDQRRKVHYHYSDPSGVILDESQSGKTINVQRGFEESSTDRTKLQKEETEVSIGDSSSVQKTRQHSSSSVGVATGETRRVQLPTDGHKPGVLTTTYTHNSSGTSESSSEQTSGGRGIIFHTESSSGHDVFRPSHKETFGTEIPSIEESHKIQSGSFEERWEGSHTSSSGGSTRFQESESDRRYQEVLRQQELQRLREEEHKLILERQREEEARRRLEEEERVILERRREEEERRRLEEESRRREEERFAAERRREQEERLRQNEREREYVYGTERKYGSDDNTNFASKFHEIVGDREDSVASSELGIRMKNVTSTQELEKLFASLSSDSHNRQAKQFVQFTGRFRTSADKRMYIEFQDGSMFPLQDSYGGQSYGSDANDSRFLRLEGELTIGHDGKGFIVLKDGRRFPLQGSYTYTEERTYKLGAGARGTAYGSRANSEQDSQNYDRSWQDRTSGYTTNTDGYETRYTSRSHEERRTEEKSVNTRIHNNENYDPNHLSSRLRREKQHRHRREVEDEPPAFGESPYEENADYVRETEKHRLCESANCVTLRCVLGPLQKDEEVWIGARYRMNAATLKKVAFKEKVKVSTKLVAKVTKQPFIGTPVDQVIKSHEIFTNIEPSTPPAAPDVIPLWIVVLSACAGAIILLLLIFLLYKCGFFKRNRPSDAPERQPLNRNGHFQGDDH